MAHRANSTWCAATLSCCLIAAGCSNTHTVEPYRSDSDRAAELEVRAEAQCRDRRGPDGVPPRAFTTDGCSASPDGGWVGCCVEHDIEYWCGGPTDWRQEADRTFRACVAKDYGAALGAAMYWAVRSGGSSALPFSWRWAYGWDWRDERATRAVEAQSP